MKKKEQSKHLVSVKGAAGLKKAQQELTAQGYYPAPMPNDFGHTNSPAGSQHTWEAYIHTQLMAKMDGAAGNAYPTIHLSGGFEVPVSDVGTKGRGYISWGAGNRKPNTMTLLREASPYPASAHRFNTDLCAGRGPRPMYAYTQYVGGNITDKQIPFKDAGVLIKGWIRDLKKELMNITASPSPSQNIPANPSNPSDPSSPSSPSGPSSPSASDDLAKDIRSQITALEADYVTWEKSNTEINEFLRRNNLHLSYLSLTEDMQEQNICFPEIALNMRSVDADNRNLPTSRWEPKIVSIRYRSAHTCRLERRGEDGIIRYVYVSNQWQDNLDATAATSDEYTKVGAIRALDPQAPLDDLNRIVREAKEAKVKMADRPTHFILPVTYPSAGRPYYPVPAWQSIFSGDIYEYLMTMVSDRNLRRKNSNVIGRILYLNNEYMQSLYFQKQADTPEAKLEVFNELRNQINTFLEDRQNTGKPLVAYTFLGADGKTYESWKIVEIEANNKNTAEANKAELAEISSIVFFAFGLDSRLVGNTPGDVSSSGGTDLRERYMLKQLQMSPMQQLLLTPLYLVKYFNKLDDHLEWEIPREVLTTLDNSKTGITKAAAPE